MFHYEELRSNDEAISEGLAVILNEAKNCEAIFGVVKNDRKTSGIHSLILYFTFLFLVSS
jgi:hypothetical protein